MLKEFARLIVRVVLRDPTLTQPEMVEEKKMVFLREVDELLRKAINPRKSFYSTLLHRASTQYGNWNAQSDLIVASHVIGLGFKLLKAVEFQSAEYQAEQRRMVEGFYTYWYQILEGYKVPSEVWTFVSLD